LFVAFAAALDEEEEPDPDPLFEEALEGFLLPHTTSLHACCLASMPALLARQLPIHSWQMKKGMVDV